MKTAKPTATGQAADTAAIGENCHQLSPVRSALLDALLANANLLTNEESAAYLGVTPGTLDVWRCTKRYNIPYIKVGRLVRYKKSSLDAFIESRTVEA